MAETQHLPRNPAHTHSVAILAQGIPAWRISFAIRMQVLGMAAPALAAGVISAPPMQALSADAEAGDSQGRSGAPVPADVAFAFMGPGTPGGI